MNRPPRRPTIRETPREFIGENAAERSFTSEVSSSLGVEVRTEDVIAADALDVTMPIVNPRYHSVLLPDGPTPTTAMVIDGSSRDGVKPKPRSASSARFREHKVRLPTESEIRAAIDGIPTESIAVPDDIRDLARRK